MESLLCTHGTQQPVWNPNCGGSDLINSTTMSRPTSNCNNCTRPIQLMIKNVVAISWNSNDVIQHGLLMDFSKWGDHDLTALIAKLTGVDQTATHYTLYIIHYTLARLGRCNCQYSPSLAMLCTDICPPDTCARALTTWYPLAGCTGAWNQCNRRSSDCIAAITCLLQCLLKHSSNVNKKCTARFIHEFRASKNNIIKIPDQPMNNE
jgi:hypothetical protein